MSDNTQNQDTDGDVLATIKAPASQLSRMLSMVSMGSGSNAAIENFYLNIGGDELRLIGNMDTALISYCTFDAEYFSALDGSTQAIIPVQYLLDLIDLVSDGNEKTVTLEFRGDPDEQLARQVRVVETLQATVMLKTAEQVLQRIQIGIKDRFNDEGIVLSGAGEPVSTTIDTTVGTVEKIIEAADLRNESAEDDTYYSIVVEDGDLTLDVGASQNSRISGTLAAEVEGDDLSNLYDDDLKLALRPLSGDVRLSTEADRPLAIYQSGDHYDYRVVISVLADVAAR